LSPTPPRVDRETVARLWLHRQGLAAPRGAIAPGRSAFRDHLLRTGGLQLDPINAVDRAHYLTLWSRFGSYDRRKIDRWSYRDGVAYEYWGHEASILPIEHLPLGLRRMRRFPPDNWRNAPWWQVYNVSSASKRRVLRRLRAEGPLESAHFERRPEKREAGDARPWGNDAMSLPKEDKRALQLMWHDGRVAVRTRRHFRRVFDLSSRVYPDTPAASVHAYHDSWLLTGLSGNGIASEAHLMNYITAPAPNAADRKRLIARNLKKKRIVELHVEGFRMPFYALAEHLELIDGLAPPRGTNLICPFDSLLWQRKRAEQLLDFVYRIEIYVPKAKRRYGYYALPILHDGRLVGRLDPKLHRDRSVLEVKSIHLEEGFEREARFERGLADALADLAEFCGATAIETPGAWRRALG